jgi:hypothetical protein
MADGADLASCAREWAGPGNRPGPRMYEMQGPGPVFGRWPAGCPAGVLVNRPAAGTRHPLEAPVSRFFLRSGVAPGVVPVSGSDVFLLPGTPVAQEFRALISRFFRCPQNVHSEGHVVPRSRHFSTGPSTTSAQATTWPFRTGDHLAVPHRRPPSRPAIARPAQREGPCGPEPVRAGARRTGARAGPEPAQDRSPRRTGARAGRLPGTGRRGRLPSVQSA